MKKLSLISLACFVFQFAGNAQNIGIGLTAGAAFSNYSIKVESITVNGKSRTGMTAGIVADIPLGKNVSFQPAANYVQYGATFEESDAENSAKDQVKINAIEIPLNVLYNQPAGKGRFFIGAGPSLSFHLSGKRKSYDSYSGNTEATLKFGNSADADMKAINIGVGFITGYGFANGLLFSACYNTGLSNLEVDTEDGVTSKSHYFGIRIGYLLNGHENK